jgi:signal transduction histidine kinase
MRHASQGVVGGKSRYRVIVVDDSIENRDALVGLLTELGYAVESAGSGMEALGKAGTFRPHLFLIDVMMPEMTGLELLRRLDVHNSPYEAIMITGHENLPHARKAMELGALSYIGKPVAVEELADQVRRALASVALKKREREHAQAQGEQVRARTAELAQATAMLDEKERLMDGILSGTSEGILAVDTDGRIMYMNARAQAMLGISFGEFAGEKLTLALRGKRYAAPLAACALGTTYPLPGCTLSTRPDAAGERHLSVRASDFVDAKGVARGRILDLSDETERVEAERMRDFFLSSVAHELRTPINIVLNYLALLRSPNFTSRDAQEILTDMDTVGKRLKYLTNNLVLLAAVSNADAVVEREPVDIVQLIRAQVETLERVALEKGITVGVRGWAGGLVTSTNARFLSAAVRCLLSNAIKFSRQGGEVGITMDLRQAGGRRDLWIAVEDHGIGISKEVQTDMFRSFMQGEDPMTRRHGGIGIGLFLVKRIADLLGGHVDVRSVVDEGSTFTLAVPLVDG